MIEILALLLATGLTFASLYIRYLIKQMKNISQDFFVVRAWLLDHRESLKAVHETEMFYGEPVLQALVEETKDLSDRLQAVLEEYDYEWSDFLEAAA